MSDHNHGYDLPRCGREACTFSMSIHTIIVDKAGNDVPICPTSIGYPRIEPEFVGATADRA